MGWEITKEYSDEEVCQVLRPETNVPHYNEMCKDAYRKRFDAQGGVLGHFSFGRSMKELVSFLSDMKDRDIGIVSVRQGFDTSTTMGEMMFQFVEQSSSWEREMIRGELSQD